MIAMHFIIYNLHYILHKLCGHLLERAAHSVYHIFSLLCLFCSYVCFPFRFRGRGFGSDCASYWSLLSFYFLILSEAFVLIECKMVFIKLQRHII